MNTEVALSTGAVIPLNLDPSLTSTTVSISSQSSSFDAVLENRETGFQIPFVQDPNNANRMIAGVDTPQV